MNVVVIVNQFWLTGFVFLNSLVVSQFSNNVHNAKKNPLSQSSHTNHNPIIPDFLPKLMIFEPDRLFWPFCVETEVAAPFGMRRRSNPIAKSSRKNILNTGMFGQRELVDRNGSVLNLYKETPLVIQRLQNKGVALAVAQTTPEIATMRHLLHLFEQDGFFSYMQLDMDPPLLHVEEIKNESKIDLKDFVYFGSNLTVLNELKKKLKILTLPVSPETGISVKHIYAAIYLYNIRPFLKLINGKLEFVVPKKPQ